MSGKLSIVSTPIGNLGDITYRAVEVLKEADVILAEDTRSAGKLLQHYQITGKQVVSFFEGNEERRIETAIAYLRIGNNIALISEAGTPLISDPGYKLVREIVKEGVEVESIPGPTAVITALTLSGLPTNAFLYLGFLPKKDAHVRRILMQTKDCLRDIDQLKTIVFYESPYRILKTLNSIKDVFGDIEVVVARELTKIHQEVRRENVNDSIQHFTKTKPKGEFTVLFSA